MSTAVDVIPRGLHHLEATVHSKFAGRFPSRVPHPTTKYVQPSDRIRRWNIRPGDRVRLMVGRPEDKYIDETKGPTGGWRVHTVRSVELETNRVHLAGVGNKHSATVAPLPPNFDSLPEEERQQIEGERRTTPANRPVHYSNVQLCVEEAGPDSIFASRIATSPPSFDMRNRRMVWNRYAAKLSGPSSLLPDSQRGLVQIPWPQKDVPKPPEPTNLDTSAGSDGAIAGLTTLSLSPAADLVQTALQNPTAGPVEAAAQDDLALDTAEDPIRDPETPQLPQMIPLSLRSPPPTSQYISDQYIASPEKRLDPQIDSLMPLYLSEELSPRFSRAKRIKAWNERNEVLAAKRDEAAKDAVKAWEEGGRDRGLEQVLARPEVGLEGVTVRGRTRKEVREAALAEFDAVHEASRREAREAARMGRSWVQREVVLGADGKTVKVGEWAAGEKDVKLERKRAGKAKKAAREERRMSGLRLVEGRNMVVPDEARA